MGKSTTILRGGRVVELDPIRVEERDLVLRNAQIIDASTAPEGARVLDVSGQLVFPGLVLAHTHLYSALARGMPGPTGPTPGFRQILEEVWWKLDVALDEQSLAASAEIGAMEALEAGVTTLIDHHESPRFIHGSLDVIAEATERVGLRSVLTYGATDRHGPEGARAGLEESVRFADKTRGHHLSRGMIGLHAPFTCSDETLRSASLLAQARGLGVHLHASEGPDDQEAAKARFGSRLMPALDRLGLLGEKSILAHAVNLDEVEAELLRVRGPFITHQPRSNMNNGVGYASWLPTLDRVALGTDGIDADVLGELKAAFFRRREHTGPTVWPDAIAYLVNGHRLAQQIFGIPIGKLVPGAPADVITIDYDPPTPLNSSTLASHLLFGGLSRARVRHSFVAGHHVLHDFEIVGVDPELAAARARSEAQRLWHKMSTA
ncbi:MAG: amidohydrolase family protein [Myxococcota bacterium]